MEIVMASKVAVIVGSIRRESINLKLAKALVKLAPKELQCEFVRIDDLPVFNQDHDQNPPEPVHRVKSQITVYLDIPTLGQPEVYIHFTQGLVDNDDQIVNEGTRKFLQSFMDRYATWIRNFP
jgi:NAD(P)H-dependent FMN reductase